MCTFNTDMALTTSTAKKKFKSNITVFLKPTPPEKYYRGRLLAYNFAEKNDRKTVFIERYVHDHWAVTEKGKLPDDSVVCIKTPFSGYTGKNPKADCPMCRAADEAFIALKNSGFKDPICRERFNAMKQKYQMVVPFFMINDPNNPKNDASFKCMIFTEKKVDRTKADFPEELRNKNYILCANDFVEAINSKISELHTSGAKYGIYNGENAVDFAIKVEEIPVTLNKGKANEYKYNRKVITKLKFFTEPYNIDKINKDNLDKFEFDEQYYVTNSIPEITNFYTKHYGNVIANMPKEEINMDDDDDIPAPMAVPTPVVENVSVKTEVKPNADLTDFEDDLPTPSPAPVKMNDPLVDDPDNMSDEKINNMLAEFEVDI